MENNDPAFNHSIFEEDINNQDFYSDSMQSRLEKDGKFIANKIKEYMKEVSQKEVDYQDMFNNLYLQIYDLQKAFYVSKEKFTQGLLNQGIQANPEDLYKNIEMILTRLTTVSLVKDLCHHLGLISEYDTILEKELGLIYRSNGTPAKAKPDSFSFSNQTPGDVHEGRRK